ncbi:hypothetical protein [Saccharopolyspora hattusasensis]
MSDQQQPKQAPPETDAERTVPFDHLQAALNVDASAKQPIVTDDQARR